MSGLRNGLWTVAGVVAGFLLSFPEYASIVSKLVPAGFAAYVAADWEASAREHFGAETSAEKPAPIVAGAAFAGLYEDRGRARGVILLPRPTPVQRLSASRRSFWTAAHLNVRPIPSRRCS